MWRDSENPHKISSAALHATSAAGEKLVVAVYSDAIHPLTCYRHTISWMHNLEVSPHHHQKELVQGLLLLLIIHTCIQFGASLYTLIISIADLELIS